MTIADVDLFPVEIPVREWPDPYGVAPYVSGGRISDAPESWSYERALAANDAATEAGEKLLVRLRTDSGTEGWGEMCISNPGPGDSTTDSDDEFGRRLLDAVVAPAVRGLEPWEVESFLSNFDTYPSAYYRDITPFVAAVETAMWDAWGKELGVPVHQLLGGTCTDRVPLAYCLGLRKVEASREAAQFAREAGFSTVKTKGSRYWKRDVERVKAMHEAVDGDLDFRVDPNQAWGFEDAVRFGARLEDEGIYLQFLEQPIRVDSFGTLGTLRDRLQTPIGINEDSYRAHRLDAAVRADAVDVAVLDLVAAGGILSLKKLAAVGAEAGISMAHHTNFDLGIKTAAKLHVVASTPAIDLPLDSVYYAYDDCVFETLLEYEDGALLVPDRPGLAGPVDMEMIEEFRVD